MSSKLIIDNWSLQHVADLLSDGASHNNVNVIRVSEDSHRYDDISEAVIQTEALFELLTQIVLKDEILVDAAFTNSWDVADTPLLDLYRAKRLRPVPFTDHEEHFAARRSCLVDRLCVTSSLRNEQRENETSWAENRMVTNPFLSAVLWGGAGMMARSSFFETPYWPHPQRRRLLVETGMLLDGPRAFDQLQNVVRTKRLDIVKGKTSNDPLYAVNADVPPIPIQVINESSSPDKFIQTALALREQYRPLREWLRSAEAAIDQGDMAKMSRIDKMLDKIGTAGLSDLFSSDDGTTISIGFSHFRFTTPININAIRNIFGVRAIMNRMVFGESGHNALSRYCSLLGLSGSPIEHELFENYRAPLSKSGSNEYA